VAFTDDVPDAAVLGCFWAVAEDDSIVAMRAEWVETTERRQRQTAALSIADLLRANVGKNVTLEIKQQQHAGSMAVSSRCSMWRRRPPRCRWMGDSSVGEDVVGTTTFPLLIRGDDPLRVPVTGSFTPDGFPGSTGTLFREITPRGGNWVVIVQNDRKMVLPVHSVESVTGGVDVVTDVTREQEVFTRSKRLHFNFGAKHANQKVALHLFYFTPGLRWIPTYRVGGELVDKANLALQGEILNEVGDIDHAALDLVVGVPNFRFADTLSPLTLETALRATLQPTFNMANNGTVLQSQFRGDNRFRGGQYAGQASGAGGGGGGGGEAAPAPGDLAMAPELAGSGGEQDLFVYNLGDFSLKKGARATAPLWRQTAPLRHIYTYDIRARRNRAGGGILTDDPLAAPGAPGQEQQQDARTPNRIVLNQVWHQLELTNGSAVPWTTGAALLLRGNLPLGQDLLVYTPPNGKARLPVTVAVDIRGSADEQETAARPTRCTSTATTGPRSARPGRSP
jgi:hypothetical protein